MLSLAAIRSERGCFIGVLTESSTSSSAQLPIEAGLRKSVKGTVFPFFFPLPLGPSPACSAGKSANVTYVIFMYMCVSYAVHDSNSLPFDAILASCSETPARAVFRGSPAR